MSIWKMPASHRESARHDDACQSSLPRIIEGGTGTAALERVSGAVESALAQRTNAQVPRPLFVVAPNTNREAAQKELSSLHIPRGAGVLLRTSGSTTGQGKIVALPWDTLLYSGEATHSFLGGAGTWINTLPLHHIAGFQTVVRSVAAGFVPLYVPIRSTHHEQIAPKWHNLAAQKCPNQRFYISLVPTQLLRLLDDAELLSVVARVVDAVVVGGAASSPGLLERARHAGLNVVTSYGMTETCGGCVYDGVAIGDTIVSLDDDARISLTGSVVGLGYLMPPDQSNLPAAQELPAGARRVHETADYGCWKADKLHVLGRIDDAVTTGGLTVIPQLIEEAIFDCTGIDAVVVGIPDPTWGECAVAVLKNDVSNTDLRGVLNEKLERGWTPKHIVTLENLFSRSQEDRNVSPPSASSQSTSPHDDALSHKVSSHHAWRESRSEWPQTSSGKIDRRKIRNEVIAYFAHIGDKPISDNAINDELATDSH
ncbi:AMP-binding protein [Arcanobacterium bovis]|uniref:AMP-dependent synthetase/ligase domain-containing protein n=1 Tax=Arcanobacterium bovis TaxID=2529275 RepID=A0A4Q9V182_9ACTO|nr:AMP-binding protein [Arcanobacterium bovis]TBW21516.1 hypothetical protein EZJ44_06130 [Arcanobacterium bovis]